MAPPPPPPAPPPPPMGGPPAASPPKLSKGSANDRNALLSQIRGGAKLKRAKVVNDRSAPIIDAKSSNTSSGTKPTSGGFNSSTSGGPPGLGGLFAGGVPKLKPTGSKLNGLTVSANKVNNNFTKAEESVRRTSPSNTSSIKTSLEEKFQQNNSSFLHSNTASQNSGYGLSVANNSNKFHTMKAREKPSYMSSEGKGQAPQVPMQGINRSNAPELPRKPPAVHRSNSQSSGRSGVPAGRPRPGPPNMKPPPPPKTTSASPSQTSSVSRKQSFTDDSKVNSTDNWNGRPDISALVSNFNQKNIRPSAPPKSSNPVMNGMSQSPAYPPPPPPVSTIPTRSNSSAVRMPSQMKSNAPNIPTSAPKMPPPVRPPIGPPPPPPHRTTSNNNANNNFAPPPPPSQTKVIPTAFRNGGAAPAPPPPIRNTSMSRDQNSCEFSSRFAQFKAIFELPAPTPMTQSNKVYPSHMQQSQRRRDPPPPPPQSNGMASHSPNTNAHNNQKKTNPVLHIQIGSTAAQS